MLPDNEQFEIFQMTDKSRRDEMFAKFRETGDALERKAVKYSSVENGKSVWIVAHPRSLPED
jgi:hypothetical protein